MTDAPATPVPASTVREFIENAINTHPVVLFMKGEPDEPRCGFSAVVVQILDHLEVQFASIDVLGSEEIRDDIKKFSDWPTIPQLYVKGEFVGGCDIIREMFQSGELQSLLSEKGVAVKAA